MRFIDLFAGLGGFHIALQNLGHECVFASEQDIELSNIYELNFGLKPAGDIRDISAQQIPQHDILCAGFPCQPFSKAGGQLGTDCPQWGDLFHDHVLRIIREKLPQFLLLENVANLARHNRGRTWELMAAKLREHKYDVDSKILSPHQFGIPQIRERMFIVGRRGGLENFRWPTKSNNSPSICSVLDNKPKCAKPISQQVENCLNVWQDFLNRSPKNEGLPSFPIWTMEFGANYPFKEVTPFVLGADNLRKYRGSYGVELAKVSSEEILNYLPSYARTKEEIFPRWKIRFIQQNRDFFYKNREWIEPWLPQILQFPSSLQKFEWNCKGEVRDIWRYIIQFRASGVRVKRTTTTPSLVAMTTTQVPIIASEKRYMTPRECTRLQNMDSLKHLPSSNSKVYKALGNAVNAKIVELIAASLLDIKNIDEKQTARKDEQPQELTVDETLN